MAEMQIMLGMLKIDLGITATIYDERLTEYLESALTQIKREGVTLDTSTTGDQHLAVMYAAWMWRRRDSMEGMPRMIRYALNNRIFAEKMEA